MSLSSEDHPRGFTKGQILSMFISVEGAMLSGLATLFLIGYKTYFSTRRLCARQAVGDRASNACDSSLFLSLLAGELLRAVGASMTLRWVLDGVINEDSFCRAQGYLKLIGTNAIDFSTLGITIHTFTILVLGWAAPKHIAKYFTAAVWIVVALITGIAHAIHPKDLMGDTGFWCWIQVSKVAQVMAEYLWMWVTGLVTAVLYGIGFLYLRPNRDSNEGDDEDVKEMRRMANELLLYPVIYLGCITPQSFGRWFSFSGYDVPYQFTLFARTLFSLSGVFNAILFFNTRYQYLNMEAGTRITVEAPRDEHNHPPPPRSPASLQSSDEKGSFTMHRYHDSASDHPFHMIKRGESSTSCGRPLGARRRSQADEEEEDFGHLP